MREENFVTFGIRMTRQERAAFQRLAEESGRTVGSVVRRLLTLTDLPEAQRLLGVPASDLEGEGINSLSEVHT